MKKLSIFFAVFTLIVFASIHPAHALSRSPESLEFPNTRVASSSSAQQVLLLRGHTLYARITGVSLSGSSDFSIPAGGDQCSGRTLLLIPSISQCSVSVVFSPTSSGSQNAELHLNTTAGNRSVSLSGTGTNADVSFSAVSFNPTNVGASDTQNVTVTNNGSADYDIAFVGLSGGNADQFLITADDCTSHVITAGGGSCQVAVRFRPENGGDFSTQLNISSLSFPSASLALNAQGLSPNLAVSIPSFNPTDVGSSDTQRFSVTNNGSGDLNISAILISGANAGQFAIHQDNCTGATVAASGGICEVDVSFLPETDGNLNAVFNVISQNAAGTAVAFSADASFTNLAFSPLNFANTEVADRNTQTLSISNLGHSDFLVMGLTLSGANPDQFSISEDACTGQTLAGNGLGSCTVNVNFNPQTVGIFLANLNVLSPGGISSTSFSATGLTQATPLLALNATQLTYVTSAVGAVSNPLTLTLSNSGNANLLLNNLLITGSHASTFTVQSDACSSTILAPGNSCEVVISYTGSAVANQTAVLVVSSNDDISENRVVLEGEVILPTPSITPSTGTGSGCALSSIPGSASAFFGIWILMFTTLFWTRSRKSE